MTAQIDFSEDMIDGIMDWLDAWENTQDEKPRSDWIIYALMELAGSVLAHAPHDLRAAVLLEALGTFAQASGVRVDYLDVSGVPETVN